MMMMMMMMLMMMWETEGRLVVKKNSISVVSPIDLGSMHDASMGSFGVADYGGSMVGRVVYPASTYGCSKFEGDKPFKSNSSSHPTILLLDRGECYFALKVWNAQQAGAAAVIIVDSMEEPLINMEFPNNFMHKPSIPFALIRKSFGQSLKDVLQKGDQEVVLKLDWSEPSPHQENM